MLVCLTGGALLFPMGTELLIVVMLISAAVAGTIAVRYGHGWNAIQRSTGDKLASVLPALLILLSIGVLIGTWMFSGTIPMLVSFGIRLVNPEYMIITAFLVTSVMSLTGSSWASAGTIGVALMGVAAATGAPLAPTAGAIVSGAYFGDKLSPLSDSTNICAIGAQADLYDHIRNMVYTAGPSFVVALVVYFVASIYMNDGQLSVSTDSNQLLHEISLLYRLNWIVFLPAAVVLYGTFTRKPAALTMIASSMVAMVVGVARGGNWAVREGAHCLQIWPDSQLHQQVDHSVASLLGVFKAIAEVNQLRLNLASAKTIVDRLAHVSNQASQFVFVEFVQPRLGLPHALPLSLGHHSFAQPEALTDLLKTLLVTNVIHQELTREDEDETHPQ